MRSGFVIVRREQLDLLVECRFVEDDHMIEALTPDGAYHALDVSSLPRRSWRRKHFPHAHVLDLSGEVVTVVRLLLLSKQSVELFLTLRRLRSSAWHDYHIGQVLLRKTDVTSQFSAGLVL